LEYFRAQPGKQFDAEPVACLFSARDEILALYRDPKYA
jgi:hypothetical protein